MLIAFWEGNGGAAPPQSEVRAYDIPTNKDFFTAVVEKDLSLTFAGSDTIGGIVAYNNTIVYPYSGSTSCPDIIAGTQLWSTQTKTTLNYFVRHCNGSYDVYANHRFESPQGYPQHSRLEIPRRPCRNPLCGRVRR